MRGNLAGGAGGGGLISPDGPTNVISEVLNVGLTGRPSIPSGPSGGGGGLMGGGGGGGIGGGLTQAAAVTSGGSLAVAAGSALVGAATLPAATPREPGFPPPRYDEDVKLPLIKVVVLGAPGVGKTALVKVRKNER